MADNIAVTAGTGTTVHADEYTHDTLGSGKTQLVKLVDGTLDSSTAIAAGGGVEAGALRVTIANDSTGVVSIDDNGGAVTVDGTVTANLSATDNTVLDNIQTAVELIDNAISGAGFNVTQLAGAAVPIGAGTEAAALRVTIATDSTGVLSIDDNAGALTVDGTVTAELSATDNAVLDTIDAVLDTINAKLVTGTVIGDVNLGATDNAVLDTIAAKDFSTETTLAAINAKMVTGTDIGDVTINNGAGAAAVNIQDGGNTITVDGTVAATQSGTWNVGTVTTVTNVVHVDDNAGSITVDVGTALPAGTNAIGKLAANSGVDIGDVDVLSIAAGANVIGDVGISGARTAGGSTPHKNIDVDESEDAVKAAAGQVYWIHAINTTNAPLYLKFYNATVANVVVGTTVPDLTFPVPGNADSDGAGFTLSIPNGIAFSTAITIAATTGVADNDTGAPGANALIVNLGYA